MKSAIFRNVLLFLFMQSIVPAQNTTCYECTGTNSKTCEHKEIQCPQNSSCMTISEEYKSRGEVYYSMNKRCAMNLPCDRYIYAYTDTNLMIRLFLKCCNGDRCNSGNYEMPEIQKSSNGVSCPSCHAYDTLDWCTANRSTVCWGKDDLCLKWRGTVIRPDGVIYNVSAQGCGSALACKYDYTEAASLKIINEKDSACYLPTDSPPLQKEKPDD